MPRTMPKTAHYRRAIWNIETDDTLSDVIDRCLEDIADGLLPSFELGGGEECVVARRNFQNGWHFMHLVTYEAGAPVAVIKKIAGLDVCKSSTPNGQIDLVA